VQSVGRICPTSCAPSHRPRAIVQRARSRHRRCCRRGRASPTAAVRVRPAAPERGFWAPRPGGRWVKGPRGLHFIRERKLPEGYMDSKKKLAFGKVTPRCNIDAENRDCQRPPVATAVPVAKAKVQQQRAPLGQAGAAANGGRQVLGQLGQPQRAQLLPSTATCARVRRARGADSRRPRAHAQSNNAPAAMWPPCARSTSACRSRPTSNAARRRRRRHSTGGRLRRMAISSPSPRRTATRRSSGRPRPCRDPCSSVQTRASVPFNEGSVRS
jgi:hypothetical protein